MKERILFIYSRSTQYKIKRLTVDLDGTCIIPYYRCTSSAKVSLEALELKLFDGVPKRCDDVADKSDCGRGSLPIYKIPS
jgi:hypothetical protein